MNKNMKPCPFCGAKPVPITITCHSSAYEVNHRYDCYFNLTDILFCNRDHHVNVGMTTYINGDNEVVMWNRRASVKKVVK